MQSKQHVGRMKVISFFLHARSASCQLFYLPTRLLQWLSIHDFGTWLGICSPAKINVVAYASVGFRSPRGIVEVEAPK